MGLWEYFVVGVFTGITGFVIGVEYALIRTKQVIRKQFVLLRKDLEGDKPSAKDE